MENNNEVKRTQGKWYVSKELQKDKNMCPIPYYEIETTKDITWIALVSAGSLKEDGEGKANAEFICKAVNEYDKLKADNEVLLNALKEIEAKSWQKNEWTDVHDINVISRKAINQVESK